MSERAKRDVRAATYDAEREIDRLFTTFGRGVAASLRAHAEQGTITPVTRHFVLADLDPLLDAVYGVARGQPSALGEMIVRICGEARVTVIDAAVTGIRTMLKGEPELLRAIGDEQA